MFFNSDTADFLQQVAVFFEISGLMLVVIEIYFEKLATQLEVFFDRKSELIIENTGKRHNKMRKFLNRKFDQAVYFVDWSINIVHSIRLSDLFKYFIYFLIITELIDLLSNSLLGFESSFFLYFVMLITLLLTWAAISFFLYYIIYISHVLIFSAPILPIALTLRFFDWLAKGKALGGLGLTLAAIGLSFEMYQITEMCLSTGCYGHSTEQ